MLTTEFISEDSVKDSNYEFVYTSDLNNDDLKEFFFCHFVPQHGGCEGVLISFIGNIWSGIFEFNGYPEYVWGIVPLQCKTNGYYDLCKDGVKYVFCNGTEYMKE